MPLVKTYSLFPEDIEWDNSHYLYLIFESKYRYSSFVNYNAVHASTVICEYELKGKQFTLELCESSLILNTEGFEVKEYLFLLQYKVNEREQDLIEKHTPVLKLYEQKESPIEEFHGAFYSIEEAEAYLASLV